MTTAAPTSTPAPQPADEFAGNANRRVRVPTVVQMEEADCGAASLAMVLAHYGCWVPLEELRVACGVSRDGANALSVVEAARHYGMNSTGGRATIDELRAKKVPAVLFWRQSHFVVLEGFSGDTAYVNNPTGGEQKLTMAEFEKSYSGIALYFSPGPNFKKRARDRIGITGSLGHLLRSSVGALSLIIFTGVLLAIPGVAASVLTSLFVDDVIGVTGQVPVLQALIGAFAVVTLLMFGLTLVQQLLMLRLQMRLSGRMTGGFLTHMMSLPASYFDMRQPGGLAQKVLINVQVAQLLSGQIGTVAVNAISMVVYVSVMVLYSVPLTLVGIGLASINLLVLWLVARLQVVENQRLQQAQVLQSAQAFTGISLITNIKATGGENEFFDRWAGAQAVATNAEQRVGKLTQGIAVIPSVLLVLNTVVVLAVGAGLIFDGSLTIGQLVAFQGLLLSFVTPLGMLVSAADQFQSLRGQLEQLNDVTTYPSDPKARSLAQLINHDGSSLDVPVARLAGHIELRDVSFGYNPSKPPFLTGFNLTIEPGQRVALVGPSVSGKSTVANLIAGIFDPGSGDIIFDGQPRDSWPRELVTASLAKVDQNIMLFQGTVLQNITLFDAGVPLDAVHQAAEDAQIASEIHQRVGGYSSMVNEGGTNFSGGQAQRLEIARSLAHNPSILLLDEATSALDAEAERNFMNALRARGITVLMIAHRLSSVRDCDLIVMMDDGKVVGSGTHEYLMANCPPYVTLVGSL